MIESFARPSLTQALAEFAPDMTEAQRDDLIGYINDNAALITDEVANYIGMGEQTGATQNIGQSLVWEQFGMGDVDQILKDQVVYAVVYGIGDAIQKGGA